MGEHRGRMRGGGVLAAVLLISLTLGGCSLIGDGQRVWNILQEEANQQETLSTALDELRALEGVESVSSRFKADGPSGDEVDITVAAQRDVTVPQLVNIAKTAGEALTGVQFRSAVALFTVEIDNGSTLTQRAFAITEDKLASEIAYWRAAEDAIGAELSLSLMEVGNEPPYHRELKPASSNDALVATDQFIANYADLLATADTTKAVTWWLLPGFMSSPDLPPVEVIDLLDRVRGVSPLMDYTTVNDDGVAPEGAAVWWQGEQPGARVIVNTHELRESDWPMVLELARLAISVPGTSFGYEAMGGEQYDGFHFYTADCGGEAFVEPNDRVLVDALAEDGVVLPAGGPGFCHPPPPIF